MQSGRPRNFDRDKALDAAQAVFWRDGYLGTSLNALTEAMGINKPSLYATFGNKAELYLEAVGQYCRQQLFRHAEALAQDDIKTALQRFLQSVAQMLTAKNLPGGCMVVNSLVSCESGLLPENVNDSLIHIIRHDLTDILRQRLRQESQLRAWPDGQALEGVVDYVIALMTGMAVMSRTGVSRARLYKIIDQSLRHLTE